MRLNKILPQFKGLYFLLKKIKYKWMGWKFNKPADRIIQTASTTFFDRHPDLFTVMSKLTDANGNIRILSFGSSTGEECQSLRKYFPHARIVGAEVNRDSRNKAIANNQDENILFVDSEPNLIAAEGPFDIVFALSVLCKNPEAEYTDDLSDIYPFEQYCNLVNELSAYVKTKGWLVIRSSNYRFMDTDASKNYLCCQPEGVRAPIDFPKFDSKGKKLVGYLETQEIFQKQ